MTKPKPIAFLDIDGVLNRSYSKKRGKLEGARRVRHKIYGMHWWMQLTPTDYAEVKKGAVLGVEMGGVVEDCRLGNHLGGRC